MKLYYFYTLKAMWDGQGKSKMYYGMSRVKKQLSGKRSIITWNSNKELLLRQLIGLLQSSEAKFKDWY